MFSSLRRLLPAGLMMVLLVCALVASARADTTLKVIPQASLRYWTPSGPPRI